MQDESVDESVDKAVKAIRKADPGGWLLPRMPSEETGVVLVSTPSGNNHLYLNHLYLRFIREKYPLEYAN